MKNQYTFIGPIHQLVTMADMPLKGALSDEALSTINQAGLLLEGDKILKAGDFEVLKSEAEKLETEMTILDQPMVIMPGLVDSHTHICFGGSRARDYAMRNAGKTYLEIAKAGGGIWDTVTQTRKASQEELTAGIEQRAARHLSDGVTTIEVKSGYGLSVDEELKMLRAIQAADTKSELIPTCLAAHIKPKDFDGDFSEYLTHIAEELFPILKEEGLTNRMDAFIEEEAFSAEVIKPYFEKAKAMGFDITVHADQFSTSGSQVAVDFEALSADHLEASGEEEVQLLADSNVIATALPGASMGLGCAYTPARKILDAGGAVAVASDWNPGSAPMGDLLMQAAILGTFQKLSNTELLAGLTYRAAAALKLQDRGRLVPGQKADFIAFPTTHINEVFYQQGKLKPAKVWVDGQLAFEL
ncbi:imidazolonepropionase [Persicobacter diffluens]|uniref:Imidazolonepropionase n=1 Tax=Persicobacter diffluens TaxID=981 RepID=A0AAN5AND0_9BACT|nr:imidazolonepropionase [Persicobacter diffluens]